MAQRRGQNEPVLGVDYRQRKITIQNRECRGGSREMGVADTRPDRLSHCGDSPPFFLSICLFEEIARYIECCTTI